MRAEGKGGAPAPRGLKPAAWRLKGFAWMSIAFFAFTAAFWVFVALLSKWYGAHSFTWISSAWLASGALCLACGILALCFARKPAGGLRAAFFATCWASLALHAVLLAVLFFTFKDFVVFSFGGLVLIPPMLSLARQVR